MESKKIYSYLENKILSNELKKDDKLQSENQLCVKFNVSRNLIRDVYNDLIIDGYIHSQKGKGYFVNDKKFWMKNLNPQKKFPEYECENKLLDFKIDLPNWFLENYNLESKNFQCYTKARYLNNKELCLTYIFLNLNLIPNPNEKEIENSVISYLSKRYDFSKSYNFIKIQKADQKDKEYFGLNDNSYVVCEYSIIFNSDETILQCSLDKSRIEDFNFGYIARVV
ncbi:GntR family transcriptional regulator [Spiroplasma tabanidicola]|uniref:GntR family transcriptional regulator n=1 Tax=Spiroplasma tabanidicola TaxID=324079 RepID=A0A6I6C5R7_9MOLU|nr:GntR family transcriptional regulator [Spiroplasma tabanidicola]QGS51480.1 GntR family transcriptional regulator [Spiroplasma tabanidicola]